MRFTRNGLLTAALVVAALFIGSFVTERLPQPAQLLGETPFLHDGVVGAPVRLRTADVTVAQVQAAKRVELYGQVAESSGLWLVFDVVWAAGGEASRLAGTSPVVVAADGRRFGGAQAVLATCGPAQPGLPVSCQLPFEVPADALEGARLLIPAEGNTRTNDDVADIDLGIDAATAARFADTDAHVALLTSTVVAG